METEQGFAEAFSVPGQLFVSTKSAEFAPLIVMPEICTAPLPLFVTKTVCAAAGICSVCGEKLMLAGVTEIDAPAPPVPDSGTVCGEPDTLSENEMAADCAPAELGVNVTVTLHCAPAASVPPLIGQLVPDANANSDAFAPVNEIVLICSDRVPVFASATVCGALVVPTLCGENASDVGARLTAADGGTPAPESGTL